MKKTSQIYQQKNVQNSQVVNLIKVIEMIFIKTVQVLSQNIIIIDSSAFKNYSILEAGCWKAL